MIDCKINIDKKPDPKGDRVILTFEYVLAPLNFLSLNFSISVASSCHMRSGEEVFAFYCRSSGRFTMKVFVESTWNLSAHKITFVINVSTTGKLNIT